jgi:hypothetical protein
MSDLIEYALSEGYKNSDTHIESLAIMRKEANSTMGFLIAGGGAALGYAIKLLETSGNAPVMIGLFGVSIYLFLLCGLLLWKCLCADSVMPTHCEPKNVFLPDYDVTAIKRAEIRQLQERCDFNRRKASDVGYWLNLARGLVFLTPLIFVAEWVLASRVLAVVAAAPCASLAVAVSLAVQAMVLQA